MRSTIYALTVPPDAHMRRQRRQHTPPAAPIPRYPWRPASCELRPARCADVGYGIRPPPLHEGLRPARPPRELPPPDAGFRRRCATISRTLTRPLAVAPTSGRPYTSRYMRLRCRRRRNRLSGCHHLLPHRAAQTIWPRSGSLWDAAHCHGVKGREQQLFCGFRQERWGSSRSPPTTMPCAASRRPPAARRVAYRALRAAAPPGVGSQRVAQPHSERGEQRGGRSLPPIRRQEAYRRNV